MRWLFLCTSFAFVRKRTTNERPALVCPLFIYGDADRIRLEITLLEMEIHMAKNTAKNQKSAKSQKKYGKIEIGLLVLFEAAFEEGGVDAGGAQHLFSFLVLEFVVYYFAVEGLGRIMLLRLLNLLVISHLYLQAIQPMVVVFLQDF